eukprot:1571085-Pyramimonas_sp.AAC.1
MAQEAPWLWLAAAPAHLQAQYPTPGAEVPQLAPPCRGLADFLHDRLEGTGTGGAQQLQQE